MTTRLDFTGRTAVVTGAGTGIGRAYAELLVARGANVVVNDLGTKTAGGGSDPTRAQEAVEHITAAGGTALADSSDVATTAGALTLVTRALDEFGAIDVVVNNAGIFRMDDFPNVDVEDMRTMFDVHVVGSFNVTKAAWGHMAANRYGRVVLTTSTSGLGAADTIAYTTAKLGVLGMGRALAQAGIPSGIKVNMVAPMAMTRMMSTGMGLGEAVPDAPERTPALVAPLVAQLCHESCEVTGETFVSGMRRVSRLFIAETAGYVHPGLDLSPEDIAEQWQPIVEESGYETVHDTPAWGAINERYLSQTPVTGTPG